MVSSGQTAKARSTRSGKAVANGQAKPGPTIVSIFGATGDLTARKLMPSLFHLFSSKRTPAQFRIVGVGRSYDESTFRDAMRQAIQTYADASVAIGSAWDQFDDVLTYDRGDFADDAIYERLRKMIDETEATWGAEATHVHYLAVPPDLFDDIVKGLAKAGLNGPRDRVVIEKPFGTDLQSAQELNDKITACFQESQIFRIDHYLGKETVQNLLAFRFGNAFFEPIWNRTYIDHVQMTVAETVGVEKRGAFYERAGALRDMIQNHMLQLLCLIGMEPPNSFDADSVIARKVDVLKAIRPFNTDDIYSSAVRGQYGSGWVHGEKAPGYRAEANVDPSSNTETFAALRFFIDNWRWQDVPFFVRTGKRLPEKLSTIIIQFRPVPHTIFPQHAAGHWEANRLIINIQPNEGVVMRLHAKQPGSGMKLRPVNMRFSYEESFGAEPREAYETLLYDVMIGDKSLFMRDDQEDAAWKIITPILEAWADLPVADFPNYAAGSWGPADADALIARDGGRNWIQCSPEDED